MSDPLDAIGAIAIELRKHRYRSARCSCGVDYVGAPALSAHCTPREAHDVHLAEQVADVLARLSPERQAELIGGTVESFADASEFLRANRLHRVVGPWVPDQRPASEPGKGTR